LKVKNFVRADNTGYMVTEYIDGTTLVHFLKQYGNVCPSEEMFQRTMQPITDAIGYVHEKLALHRDISPDNIMIDKSGKAVLVDFGAAKLDLRRKPTASSIVPYKEAYAPVEQQEPAIERPEGYFTDIFALAGTMYCLLSGHPPERAITRSLASKDPYVPMERAAKVKCSETVYRAIDRALSLAPSDRPQTIDSFQKLLSWSALPGGAAGGLGFIGTGGGGGGGESGRGGGGTGGSSDNIIVEDDHRKRKKGNWTAYAAVILLVAAAIVALFFSSNSDGPIQPSPSPTVDLRTREASLYQSAADCIHTATYSCSLDYCLTNYRSGIGYGDRYPALKAEVDSVARRCSTPTPTPTPTPTIAARPQTPTYRVYENRDIDGGDLPGTLPHLRDADQSACEQACNDNSSCVGYAYGKWDRACYLKGSLPDLRFEPNSIGVVRSIQPRPPDYVGAKRIESAKRTFVGNRYSTSSAGSRPLCSQLCLSEDACLGYQYVSGACWRYDRIDSANKDDSTQSGVKRQLPP
jgi:serine/threonine protein kinase